VTSKAALQDHWAGDCFSEHKRASGMSAFEGP
jgi:hypothetical protein